MYDNDQRRKCEKAATKSLSEQQHAEGETETRRR